MFPSPTPHPSCTGPVPHQRKAKHLRVGDILRPDGTQVMRIGRLGTLYEVGIGHPYTRTPNIFTTHHYHYSDGESYRWMLTPDQEVTVWIAQR